MAQLPARHQHVAEPEQGWLQDVVDNVNDMSKSNDYFLLANDFATYMKAQEEVDRIYRDQVIHRCCLLPARV